jgi:hypothetical protein
MYLENLVFDALDPQRLGRFWQAALGAERLTDEPAAFETRLAIPDGPVLDLCFQQVPTAPVDELRLHLDLTGGAAQSAVVDRLIGLGARHLDVGQGDVPWVVLADPEGNPFCVMNDRPIYAGSGPIAGLPLDSADPARDARFWSWLTGWELVAEASLRHPSHRGPVLALCDEPAAKGADKNRLHLDVRLEAHEDPDEIEAAVVARGGARLRPDWGDLPWRTYTDPSGNEFCVLPAAPPSAA